MLRAKSGSLRVTAGIVLGIIALGLSGCGQKTGDATSSDAPAPGGQGVLNVYNWPDYIAEDTIRNFETRTGIRVNYQLYSSNDALMNELAKRPDAYDIVFPSARPYTQKLISEGNLSKLDRKQLGNWSNLDADILADLQQIDPGNAHAVPYMWGTTGLGVNVGKVTAALGNGAALDSWGMIFDPATAAKLSSCGIGILDDDLEAFSAALLWKGRDVNDLSPEAFAEVESIYKAIRTHVRKFANSNELIEDLATGNLCVVLTYSGDVAQAQAKAEELASANKGEATEIRYVIPREGALRWTDVVAIPKQAKNAANAHRFIQYLMEPKVAADISNYVAYANGNAASTKLLDSEISGDPGIYPPAEVRAKLRTTQQFNEDLQTRRKDAWSAVVYGTM